MLGSAFAKGDAKSVCASMPVRYNGSDRVQAQVQQAPVELGTSTKHHATRQVKPAVYAAAVSQSRHIHGNLHMLQAACLARHPW